MNSQSFFFSLPVYFILVALCFCSTVCVTTSVTRCFHCPQSGSLKTNDGNATHVKEEGAFSVLISSDRIVSQYTNKAAASSDRSTRRRIPRRDVTDTHSTIAPRSHSWTD